MSETTQFYAIPKQLASGASRQRANAALDTIDAEIHNLAQAVAGLVESTDLGNQVTEVPAGTIGEGELEFTVSHSPLAGTIRLDAYGAQLFEGVAFNMTGVGNKTLTYEPGYEPHEGQWHRISYKTTEAV